MAEVHLVWPLFMTITLNLYKYKGFRKDLQMYVLDSIVHITIKDTFYENTNKVTGNDSH